MARRATFSVFRALAVLMTVAAPEAAHAQGWYIRWQCVGECAGYGVGMGKIGPYPTEDECEWVRWNTLPIPDDSEFPHACEYIGPDPAPGSQTSAPVYVPTDPNPAPPADPTAIQFGVFAGPGWTANDGTTAQVGQFTLGVELDTHFGTPFVGAAVQLGVQGTRLRAPTLGEGSRSWFVAPAAVGVVVTPRLFTWGGDNSLWLDAGASLAGFLTFGCEGCAAAVFSKDLGIGYVFDVGVDVQLDAETGVGVQVVVPRYRIGHATPGDLALTSPPWMLQVSLVGRIPDAP